MLAKKLFLVCSLRVLSAKAQQLGGELKKARASAAAGGMDADNKDEAQMQIVGQLQTALREQAEAHTKETNELKEKLAVAGAGGAAAGEGAAIGSAASDEQKAALTKVEGERKQAVDKLREVVIKYK